MRAPARMRPYAVRGVDIVMTILPAVEKERDTSAGAPGVPGVPPADLDVIESLEYPEVVYKFVDYYDVTEAEAEAFFAEVKKWLWLCATSMHERASGKNPPELLVNGSLFWLDEMWHTFVLFTEEYQAFCHDYLGRFVHHRPTTRAEKTEIREHLTQGSAEFVQARAGVLRRQCHYICEKLGDETVVRWYREYARRYSAAELFARARMRQPAF